MTYKDAITEHMVRLGNIENVRFVGYNTAMGHKMYGTLTPCPRSKIIETPVAENLMMGLGMGLSLEGFFPVVCFERMDFILPAMDAIVNHLDKMPYISGEQYSFKMLIRCIVGSCIPLDPGLQHIGDYTKQLQEMCEHTIIYELKNVDDINRFYKHITDTWYPCISIEYKDLYTT